MIPSILLLACVGAANGACDSPPDLRLLALSPVAQDPEPEEQEVEPFPTLRGSAKKKAEDAVLTLRRGKKPEQRQEAAAALAEVGRGAVPLFIKGAFRFEDGQSEDLLAALDGCLQDADLQLAWDLNEGLKKKTDVRIRRFLVRRWVASERADTVERLHEWMKDEDDAIRYPAVVGLVHRQDRNAVAALHAHVKAHWAKQAAQIREDFAGIERGALSAAASLLINRGEKKDRVAGVHVFELLGIEEHAKILMTPLKDSDYALRLAAINACRVVIDGAAPLNKPSVFEQVERAEKWQARLND